MHRLSAVLSMLPPETMVATRRPLKKKINKSINPYLIATVILRYLIGSEKTSITTVVSDTVHHIYRNVYSSEKSLITTLVSGTVHHSYHEEYSGKSINTVFPNTVPHSYRNPHLRSSSWPERMAATPHAPDPSGTTCAIINNWELP